MTRKKSDLGLSNNLQNITVDKLLKNETAITMLLHNYRKLEDENSMLKQDLNRQATIERTLHTKKAYTKIAAIVSLFASLLLSFGINLLTNNIKDITGFVLLILGIIAHGIGLYFSFKEEG